LPGTRVASEVEGEKVNEKEKEAGTAPAKQIVA